MNVVAAVFADFVTAPAGGPSQLTTPLAGTPILVRTLRRVLQIEGVTARCLFVRARDADAAGAALAAADLTGRFDLLPLDGGARPRRTLLTAARKWNLESWRGGLLGSTWFDEFVDPPAVAGVVNHYGCEAVFCFDGHQPVLDASIASAMVRHAEANRDESKLTFTQAPPGLAGLLVRREGLQEVLEYQVPIGLVLCYRPELAQTDPIVHQACYHVSPEVARTAGRFTGDTRRSRELLESAIAELGDCPSAPEICRVSAAAGHDRAGPLPVEVEIELTTDDPLPNTTLRPRGTRVQERQVSDIKQLARIAAELATYDDRLIYLGGHGDPLRHPAFPEACRVIRAAGIFGLAVGTPLVELSEPNFAALFEHRVDVLEVLLDAHTAETYRRVHGADAFECVRANISRIEAHRRATAQPCPIAACSLVRCDATIHDLEPFYDHWLRETGAAVIRGHSTYCGALLPDTLLPTYPLVRRYCRRLDTRLTLLADGRIVACDQDVAGRFCLGSWNNGGLAAAWSGSAIAELRNLHRSGDVNAISTCSHCSEWDRP